MRRSVSIVLAALALTAPLAGCAYNAELGRQQLLIVDDAGLAQASDRAWANTLKTGYVSSDARKNARVRAVGQRVITAAGLSDRPWDYVVFLDEAPNAFVMPGGHVGVTVGLLDLVDNDDQLAAVIGHEAGHVVAHHAAERYSQQSTSKILLGLAGAAAGSSSEFGRELLVALGQGQALSRLHGVLGAVGIEIDVHDVPCLGGSGRVALIKHNASRWGM